MTATTRSIPQLGAHEAAALTDEEREILSYVRRLSREVIAPRADAIDREGVFPQDIYDRYVEMGLLGLLLPEEDGGAGASVVALSLIFMEVAAASATAVNMLSNSLEALVPIAAYANPELKREVLSRALEGGEVPGFALTEPDAGSDALAIQTTAVRDGGDWVLNGRKCFITDGSVAGFSLLFALTDPDARKGRRLSAFIVDRGTPGFQVGADEETMGLRGLPLSELILEDVRLPAERMVGERGDGLKVAMKMLNEARVGAAAQCVGISTDALRRSVEYAAQRRAFGEPIERFQLVQAMLADMAIRVESSRQLVLAAARAHDEHRGDAIALSAMCKTYASDSAVQNALDAIQIHGGSGYCRDIGVERLLRDAKPYQIFDGTNQILRLTIAKDLHDLMGV